MSNVVPRWAKEFGRYRVEVKNGTTRLQKLGGNRYTLDAHGCCDCIATVYHDGPCRHEQIINVLWRYFKCPDCGRACHLPAQFELTDGVMKCRLCEARYGWGKGPISTDDNWLGRRLSSDEEERLAACLDSCEKWGEPWKKSEEE